MSQTYSVLLEMDEFAEGLAYHLEDTSRMGLDWRRDALYEIRGSEFSYDESLHQEALRALKTDSAKKIEDHILALTEYYLNDLGAIRHEDAV